MRLCHHCGREVSVLSAVQRTDSCASCHSDLKCCLNCRFFDPGMNNQCREPQAEWQTEKAKANFCEYFEFLETATAGRGGAPADRESARSRFDSLFKKT
jgi:hypothetical protein